MIKENERTKEEQRERPCSRIRLLRFPKSTVWPPDAEKPAKKTQFKLKQKYVIFIIFQKCD